MAPVERRTTAMIVLARETAARGVDFSPRLGARCPWCKKKAAIYKTLPWDGSVRIRYHRCQNRQCVLAQMGVTIKSLEEDRTDVAGQEQQA